MTRSSRVCSASERPRAILAEKPLALGLAEGERIVAACEERGTTLAVGHQSRYARSFLRLKRAIEELEIGELESLRGICFGNLLDQGSHVLDSLRWLTGRRILWVMSQAEDDPRKLSPLLPSDLSWWSDGDHPAPAWMVHHLGLEGGLRATMETGLLYPRSRNFLDDWLERRVIAVGTHGFAEARVSGGFKMVSALHATVIEPDEPHRISDATRALHAELRDAVLGKARLRSSGRDALETLEGLLACARSAAGGGLVSLPLARDTEDAVRALAARGTVHAVANRGPAEATGSTPAPWRPRVSVVLALEQARGFGRECVDSWVRSQTYQGEIEFLAVGNGSDPVLEQEMGALLRSQDRLLRVPGVERTALYDHGARAAEGEVLVFTEAHCAAEPQCIDELVRFLSAGDCVGACARTVDVTPTDFARADARIYEMGFRVHRRPSDWRKVVPHGFAIRRDVYLEEGGFDERFEVFGEQVFAARLRRSGRPLGFAERAVVRHRFAESTADMLPLIESLARGQMRFRASGESGDGLEQWLYPSGGLSATDVDSRLAVEIGLAGLRELPSVALAAGGVAAARAALRSLRFIPSSLLGAKARASVERLKVAAADLRCRLWRNHASALDRAYADLWERAVRCTWLETYSAHASGSWFALQSPGRHPIARVSPEALDGFYELESREPGEFRWTHPVAAVLTRLPPGRHRFSMETRAIARDPSSVGLKVFLGGHRLPPSAVQIGRAFVAVLVDPDWIHSDRPQRWVFAAQALRPWLVGSPDRRELGLPVVAFVIEPG